MRTRLHMAGIVTAALCSILHPQRLPAQVPFDATLALETFDRAWQIVYDTHFDTTFNGVDWVALRDELRPRVQSASALGELRGTIREMLDRLGQSHFALIPKEVADTLDPAKGDPSAEVGDLGLEMRFVGDQLVVTTVDPDGPADRAGVRSGWVVTAVNDDRVSDLMERVRNAESRRPLDLLVWGAVQRRLQGPPHTPARVEFLDAGDAPTVRELTRRPAPGDAVKLGNLPTIFARFGAQRHPTPDGGSVGLLWFNAWMMPIMRQFDQAVDQYRDADGIVIDLRGNGGGVGAMIMGLAGHFIDDRESLGVMRTRTTTLQFVTNPRRVSTAGERVTPYAGPVAVLTDRLSASASEVFAGGMQAVSRVRVFGTATAGAVLPASMDRLPNGDVLYHAFGEFETVTGIRLEGRGVVPDEAVALTRPDLLAGRDAVLEAALRWIAHQRRDAP